MPKVLKEIKVYKETPGNLAIRVIKVHKDIRVTKVTKVTRA